MQMQDIGQNRFFSGMINCEAIQTWADTYLQYSLCGKPMLTFLKPSSELYQTS